MYLQSTFELRFTLRTCERYGGRGAEWHKGLNRTKRRIKHGKGSVALVNDERSATLTPGKEKGSQYSDFRRNEL
jgi:hypothetical protein